MTPWPPSPHPTPPCYHCSHLRPVSPTPGWGHQRWQYDPKPGPGSVTWQPCPNRPPDTHSTPRPSHSTRPPPSPYTSSPQPWLPCFPTPVQSRWPPPSSLSQSPMRPKENTNSTVFYDNPSSCSLVILTPHYYAMPAVSGVRHGSEYKKSSTQEQENISSQFFMANNQFKKNKYEVQTQCDWYLW